MQEKPVKRYVTVHTVIAANKRMQDAAGRVSSMSGTYLASGERLNRPTRVELEAAGRRVLSSGSQKKAA